MSYSEALTCWDLFHWQPATVPWHAVWPVFLYGDDVFPIPVFSRSSYASLLLEMLPHRFGKKRAGMNIRLLLHLLSAIDKNSSHLNISLISGPNAARQWEIRNTPPSQNFTVLTISSYSFTSSGVSSRRKSFLFTRIGHFSCRAKATASLGRLSKAVSSPRIRA